MQMKVDSSASFNRNWNHFKKGFNDSSGNFWLGNEKIYQMTQSGSCTLRIIFTVSSPNQVQFADYKGFKIGSEANGYQILSASISSNNVSFDSLSFRINSKFSTFDQNNGGTNCASTNQAGFWYATVLNYCGCMNLNGVSNGFCWSSATSYPCTIPLKNSQMWLIC